MTPGNATTRGAEAATGPQTHAHPLDPLSAEEIRTARDVVLEKGAVSGNVCFPAIRLHEPEKDLIRRFRPGQPVERLAWVVVHDRSSHDLYDGIVALARQEIVKWTRRPGLQGPLLLTEYDEVAELVKRDPRWREAIRRRGIDIARVCAEAPARLAVRSADRRSRLVC